MRNFKPERAHYINDTMTEQRDPESSAVAYVGEYLNGKPFAVMFSGRRQKPDSNYRYQSQERRAAAIEEHFANVRRTEAYQADRRAAVKAARKGDSSLTYAGQDYIPAPAVAALLRQCLKEAFPGQRFSVRSEGSLNVSWTDGPTAKQVERIADTFAGSYFDGMIDYKGSLYHSLDGRRVSFGCDFVFCRREFSRDALDLGCSAIAAHYNTNQAAATIEGTAPYWNVKANPDFPGAVEGRFPGEPCLMLPPSEGSGWTSGEARHALGAWYSHARPVEVQPSPTFARIAVLGSDGYGNTIDTPEGKPAGAGYPSHERKDIAEARAEVEEATAIRLAIGAGAVPVSSPAVDEVPAVEAPAPSLAEMRDLFAFMVETIDQAAAARAEVDQPRRVECEVIDFAPHLAERANAAKRCN